ncbi:unnamed protein product [Effrenium voratum]|uniref:Uncharacterized protein n=1 Tax=Effrenium voratum TaxID=2562239 RepID=A0AA36N6R4_9DINO|nr:unnamed protein product [Effrenium voratum]
MRLIGTKSTTAVRTGLRHLPVLLQVPGGQAQGASAQRERESPESRRAWRLLLFRGGRERLLRELGLVIAGQSDQTRRSAAIDGLHSWAFHGVGSRRELYAEVVPARASQPLPQGEPGVLGIQLAAISGGGLLEHAGLRRRVRGRAVPATSDYCRGDLAFPFPFLTACLSNLVAGLLVIAVLALLNRTNTREQCGEIAADAEVDLKMQLMLGVLVTCEIGAAVKVLSNVHHTMAAWVYMLTPVATILVASSNFFGMEVLRQELLVAAGVASLGGMLAVQGPLPSIEGLNALGWGCLALVFTVARCLLTQGVMCPTIGQRPGALSVAKAVLLAGCTVGVELSLVYEWHGFWSLPWLPFPGRVFQQVTVIGICDAIMVIGHTRLIQITSAAFGALLVPFYTVTVLPVESLDSLTTISLVNWLGLLLCGASAVMYFKARKNGTEPTEGYASLA